MAKKQAVKLETNTEYILLPLLSGAKYWHGVSLPCCQVRVQQARLLVWSGRRCCLNPAGCDLGFRRDEVCSELHIETMGIMKAETIFRAKYCFCVYTWNIPSADCRNGSGGSSWEVGAAPSSSSSCSVPICIPEYWLSLPSSTLCTDRGELNVLCRNIKYNKYEMQLHAEDTELPQTH